MKVLSKSRKNMKLAIVTASLMATTFTGVAVAQNTTNDSDNAPIETVLSTEEIPHGVRYVDDFNLPDGVEVIVQEGQNGKLEKVRVGEPAHISGNIDYTAKEKDVVTLAPSEEVIRVGKNKESVISGIDERVVEIEGKKKAERAKAAEEARVAAREEAARKAAEDDARTSISLPSGSSSATPSSSSTLQLPELPDTSASGVTTPAENRAFLASIVSGEELRCADAVVMKESGYVTTATNPSSGAYGVAQSLPATKYASHGSDWRTNGKTQILWMKDYVEERYGSFCGALEWHHVHNWY